MSEKELIKLCKEPKRGKMLYWTSEVYGFGKYLRKYAYYPSFLPLNIYFSHGVTHHDSPAAHEYENNAPSILFFSPRLTNVYKKNSKKPCATILSPNVFYRRKFNIKKEKEAVGTIAFPCHSTPGIDDLTDYKEYCEKLKSLAVEFHPISVCLHYHDINKGSHKIFMDNGFEVLTAGNPFHPEFIERYYNILKNGKYVTSNELGSYTYYALEMGIPFLHYGSPVNFINVEDRNIEKGFYDSFKKSKQMGRALKILGSFSTEVTEEQRKFVERELGVYDSISRFHASFILYQSYFMYIKLKAKNSIKTYLKNVKFIKTN